MEYSVVTCTNGDNLVRGEHIKTKEAAFKQFHYWCDLLYGDSSMAGKKGMVKVLDENLDCVEGKLELIDRTNENASSDTPAENASSDTPAEEE